MAQCRRGHRVQVTRRSGISQRVVLALHSMRVLQRSPTTYYFQNKGGGCGGGDREVDCGHVAERFVFCLFLGGKGDVKKGSGVQ